MLIRSITVGLLSFLTLIDLFGSQAILPRLTVFFDTNPAPMGLAVNASTFGMAAAGLIVALLSRRTNRVKGIWLSLALLSVPTTLLGFVDNLTWFKWLRIAQGALLTGLSKQPSTNIIPSPQASLPSSLDNHFRSIQK